MGKLCLRANNKDGVSLCYTYIDVINYNYMCIYIYIYLFICLFIYLHTSKQLLRMFFHMCFFSPSVWLKTSKVLHKFCHGVHLAILCQALLGGRACSVPLTLPVAGIVDAVLAHLKIHSFRWKNLGLDRRL